MIPKPLAPVLSMLAVVALLAGCGDHQARTEKLIFGVTCQEAADMLGEPPGACEH